MMLCGFLLRVLVLALLTTLQEHIAAASHDSAEPTLDYGYANSSLKDGLGENWILHDRYHTWPQMSNALFHVYNTSYLS